jgi:hypothetical protein
LPFEVNFSSDEKRREHLSNAYNVFVATLLLQETLDPIPYPKKRTTENKTTNSPLDSITSDENERENLIHEVVNKLLVNVDQNSLPDSSKVHDWIEKVVDKYEIPKEDKEDVINHIAKILRRNVKSKETTNIDWMREAGFDKIWSNEIFDNLLVFGTKICGINHFEDFRKIYSERSEAEFYINELEKIQEENNGVIPWGFINSLKDLKLKNGIASVKHKYSELIKHIKFETPEEYNVRLYVTPLEKIQEENGGFIPWGLVDNLEDLKLKNGIRSIKHRRSDLIKHIKFETSEEYQVRVYVTQLEKIQEENGGFIPWGLVDNLQDLKLKNGIITLKSKYSKLIKHIKFETLGEYRVRIYINELEKIQEENGGFIPWGITANLKLKNGIKSIKRIHSDLIKHIKFETSEKYQVRVYVTPLEKIQEENGGFIP